jgi:serine/threonine-protein kinase
MVPDCTPFSRANAGDTLCIVSDVPTPGEVIAGRYRLERQIGKGAAGVVFEATHEIIGRRVALKWLYPQLAQNATVAKRFLREARAANAVDHPNVVEIYDAGRHEESLYLVLELLRGEPLSAYLERGAPTTTDLVQTMMPALRGVFAAHERGVVHRDLKPDNIFLCLPRRGRPGGAKVLDFGISKLRDPDAMGNLTGAGTFLGSPYYMAPEQIADSSTVDTRADVYSVGVMLYEGLTQRLPFDGDSLPDLFFKITNTDPTLPSVIDIDVPSGLEEIVLKAMAPNPDDRYHSIRELGLALEAFAGGVVFETLDDAIDEVLGQGARKRPSGRLPDETFDDDEEIEEMASAPTQMSSALSDSLEESLRDSTEPIEGERTMRRTAMDLTPPPGALEPVSVTDRDTNPTDDEPVPTTPPAASSRAMAALRGHRPRDLEASPTFPLIVPDAVDGAPVRASDDGVATNPTGTQAPEKDSIDNARTVELSRPNWDEFTAPPHAIHGPRPDRGVNWLAVAGASIIIAVITAALVAFMR